MSPSTAASSTLERASLLKAAQDRLLRAEWSRERLLSFQRNALQQALRHAVEASAWYRDTLGDNVARGAPLEDLPVLTKRQLMENFNAIVTDARLSRQRVEQHLDGEDARSLLLGEYRAFATGGTTGERGIAVYDHPAWLSAIANMMRFQAIVGIDETTRSIAIFASSPVHISYHIGVELRALRPPAPRFNVLMPIEEIVEGLNLNQPEVISTYPSFLRVLAGEQQAGRLRIKPRLFRTSAETLGEELRALAADTWQAAIADSYVCTEAGPMGHECIFGDGLHLAEDSFVFEVVDENNRPVPDGVEGAKLLVTTLTNGTLPLVRYEISDVVAMATEPCPCGLPFWRIGSIAGRREETLRLRARVGGLVNIHAHRLRSPLTGAAGVRQFQFVQLPDGLEITIAVFEGVDAAAVSTDVDAAVRAALDAAGAAPGGVRVRLVEAIERTGSGAKQKLVVASPDIL
ncbi:phenylacetate--CoA ligase family protein [Ensifer sp.]|jgi:putative adenylate-forming enzyme|uniref:phenylacetate--CoA ligase family protein n=1 Tax=Ensifer sp. TaxID=1872086 RepID=UPI002E0EE36B|nr:phenylacetate--CoA ligase family protein [Ensifer sp.]